jgi:hypothetical protein
MVYFVLKRWDLMMRQIKFTEEEIAELAYESIYHKHPIIRRRMQASAEEGRVAALIELNYKGKPNRLMEKRDEIVLNLEKIHRQRARKHKPK